MLVFSRSEREAKCGSGISRVDRCCRSPPPDDCGFCLLLVEVPGLAPKLATSLACHIPSLPHLWLATSLACHISVVGCGLMSSAGPFGFGFRLIAYPEDRLFRPSVRFDGLLTPSQLSRQIV